MINENAQNIIDAVVVTLPVNGIPGEEDILKRASDFRNIFPVSDEQFEEIIRSLHARLQIKMDMGAKIVNEEHRPWFLTRKVEIDPYYWKRYAVYLKKTGWPPQVVTTLDSITDEIMDLTGNPLQNGSWERRGLVMGDVQSGKTSTYTAICCKAADAGYKLIILLSGTMENLRRQTQERLDAGFVGLDSSGFLARQRKTIEVGAGIIDGRRVAGVFTSKTKDFSSQLMNQLNFRINAFNEPILVVIKKNRRILENLQGWLRAYNADQTGKINVPMLLIDDEADNASLNTNKSDQDPTITNKLIRELINLFVKSSYVGFTATPFANIFVDPDKDEDMIGQDLFPRDFIYTLEAPDNYINGEALFGEKPVFPNCLRTILDAETIFPAKQRVDWIVEKLPLSLIHSLMTFILANAIRDIRGYEKSHRSMLVNVSRLQNVQDQVAKHIETLLKELQQDITNYSQLDSNQACQNNNIQLLKEIWEREYSETGIQWISIQRALHRAAIPIVVKSINQRTGAASLDYTSNKENGLRIVAVGGNSLSRGLTLEGLCVSYFCRNSQMYDTLMQMGRWFGYRDGYADLCRIWMKEEAMHWYAHIADATNELKMEIRRMQSLAMTPKDFGLKVRAHPDSLIVTARNKMRTAKTFERLISLSEQGVETPRLFSDIASIRINAMTAERFINEIEKAGIINKESRYKNVIWNNVHKSIVCRFLREFKYHPLNYNFQTGAIVDFLESADISELSYWDVVIPNGEKVKQEKENFAGISYYPQLRTVVNRGDGSILISGSSARVGSRDTEREGLTIEQIKLIQDEYKKKNKSIPGLAYRRKRERPLLMLHLLKARLKSEHDEKIVDFETGGLPLVAIGLSFPGFDDSNRARRVRYSVNIIEWRNNFEFEIDEEVEIDDDNI